MEIKIDKRTISGNHIRTAYGLSSKEARDYALKDISKYILLEKDFGFINYVYHEKSVLISTKYNRPFISIYF